MLDGYRSPFDATVVERLGAAGTVTLGKLNCDEFAMGSSNENSAYHVVRNPWDRARVPGGSSGGSAAAVAARLLPAATGTDTGGSIRQPASFTGITGIKPTYGVCSRYGMVAFASSLDQAGPLARSAEDCALLLGAMSGFDPRDSTSADRPPQDFHAQALRRRDGASAARPLDGLRIGLPKELFGGRGRRSTPARSSSTASRPTCATRSGRRCATCCASARRWSTSACRAPSCRSRCTTSSRRPRRRRTCRASTACATATAPRTTTTCSTCTARRRSEGFGPEVKRRIMIGTYVLSHGYYDAYYLQAQKLRRMIADDFQACFSRCDVIAGPVAPSVAWALGAQATTRSPTTWPTSSRCRRAWPACPA